MKTKIEKMKETAAKLAAEPTSLVFSSLASNVMFVLERGELTVRDTVNPGKDQYCLNSAETDQLIRWLNREDGL